MIAFAKPQGTSGSRSAEELLAEFRATGATAPFEELVRRYAAMVFSECYSVTKSRHDAEDASQATFLTLAVQARTGDEIRHLGPWLQRVARRVALDQEKSKRRRKKREDNHHTVNGSTGLATLDRESMDQLELRHIINEELQTLPAKYRMPLILHYYGGLSREQMAAELKVKPATLGVRLFRAREMLGKRLEKRGLALPAVALPLAVAMVVRESVQAHGVMAMAATSAQIADAAARVAVGLTPHVGSVSPGAMALAEQASHQLILSKVKTLLAAAAIGASALAAGGAQIVHRIQEGTLTLQGLFDLSSYLPTFGGPLPSMRVDASERMSPPAAAPNTVPATDWSAALAFGGEQGSQWRSFGAGVSRGVGGERLGSEYGGSGMAGVMGGGGTGSEGAALRTTTTMVSAPVVAEGKAGGNVAEVVTTGSRVNTGKAVEKSEVASGSGESGETVVVAGTTGRGEVSGASSGGGSGPAWLASSGSAVYAPVHISATGGTYFMSSTDGSGSSGNVELRIRPRQSARPMVASASAIGGVGASGLSPAVPTTGTAADSYSAGGATAHLTSDGNVVRGWGVAAVSGDVDMSGVVIADGYGEGRTLDFSGARSVYNTVANPPSELNGYYARAGGKLVLPAVRVKAGERSEGYFGTCVTSAVSVAAGNGGRLDLVNSAKLVLRHVAISGDGGSGEGQVWVSLLASDRAEVPAAPVGRDLLSVWGIEPDAGVTFGGLDFVARYGLPGGDMGGATAGLAVFYYSDGKWWPARSIIDPPTRQITGLDIPVTEYVALTTLAGRVDVSLEGLGVLGMGADEAEMVTVRGSVGGVARVSGYEELGTPEGLRSFSQVGGSGVVPEVSGWGAAGVLGVVGLLGRRRRR